MNGTRRELPPTDLVRPGHGHPATHRLAALAHSVAVALLEILASAALVVLGFYLLYVCTILLTLATRR
jgi:hypothetical protein